MRWSSLLINSLRQIHAWIHSPAQIRAVTKHKNLLPPLWLYLCSIQTSIKRTLSSYLHSSLYRSLDEGQKDRLTNYITNMQNLASRPSKLGNSTKLAVANLQLFVLHKFDLVCLWIDLAIVAGDRMPSDLSCYHGWSCEKRGSDQGGLGLLQGFVMLALV